MFLLLCKTTGEFSGVNLQPQDGRASQLSLPADSQNNHIFFVFCNSQPEDMLFFQYEIAVNAIGF